MWSARVARRVEASAVSDSSEGRAGGEGALAGPPDPSLIWYWARPVVGAVDDQGVGRGDVNPRLDDRGGDPGSRRHP